MMILPRIEKITRDITISHFFLMFGYKLFSLYFPLFLVAKGMSLPQVGYIYFLIYLPIVLSAPLVGFLNHKVNSAALAAAGIAGYGIYSLGMILIQNPLLFYFWQALLGVSAALFFVSAKAILMSSALKKPDRDFGWFYSAPFYAEAFAPAVGAICVWKFNFLGVFILSLVLQFFNAIFCFIQLRRQTAPLSRPAATGAGFGLQGAKENYQRIFGKIKESGILIFILISFSVLFLAGFYQVFLVLFLKEKLFWEQNQILLYVSLASLLFLPVSLLMIKRLEKFKSGKNIFQGGIIAGAFSIAFAIFGLALISLLNFFTVLFLMLGKSAGGLAACSGRSGLFNDKLKEYPKEAGVIDTIFAPLGVALGAFIGSLIVSALGYGAMFLFGGILVLALGLLGWKLAGKNGLD